MSNFLGSPLAHATPATKFTWVRKADQQIPAKRECSDFWNYFSLALHALNSLESKNNLQQPFLFIHTH